MIIYQLINSVHHCTNSLSLLLWIYLIILILGVNSDLKTDSHGGGEDSGHDPQNHETEFTTRYSVNNYILCFYKNEWDPKKLVRL